MIFIDTSAVIARHIKNDQHHKKSVSYWKKLSNGSAKLFTSSFIIDEAVTLMARWVGEDEAVKMALRFYASDAVRILRPEEQDEVNALDYLRKSSGKRFSFTDCISFVLMKRHKIKRAFAFDNDFVQAGFIMLPS